MRPRNLLVFFALFVGLLTNPQWLPTASGKAQPTTYDVVIYGATSGGVMAAVQAVRMKRTVVIVEPSSHIGGLTTSGLGWTDTGDKRVIGGLAREFYQRVKRQYDDQARWKWEDRSTYDRYRVKDDAMWTFEPHVAQKLMAEFLREHQVTVLVDSPLDRSGARAGVVKKGATVEALRLKDGRLIRGRVFIDATYEGDLLAQAGVSYTVGRESNQQYGERLNGVQAALNTHNHRFIKAVDPYRVAGDPSSGLLPGIEPRIATDGSGDHRIQAYCFRMCLTNHPENRVPFEKPAQYNEMDYELLLRNFEAGDLRVPISNGMLPNRKTDTNNNCAVSTDYIGQNYDYPEASDEQRRKILAAHLRYQQGLMWTLANHPRTPPAIREAMKPWGLAKDEYTGSGHWPPQIYVREARRMVGQYVMTEHDCMRQRLCEDSVGLGSYNMDSHNAQRYVKTGPASPPADRRRRGQGESAAKGATVQNEGDVQVSPGGAYLISRRAILPKPEEAENLLAPVALSASHIAYGSIRMEPVFMVLGQSAATLASLALDREETIHEVPYQAVRQRLIEDRQVLDLPPNSVPKSLLRAADFSGTVIDDMKATLSEGWRASSSNPPYLEQGYRHDGNQSSGLCTATFEVTLKPGVYIVRYAYTPHANRATNVPIEIHHTDGVTATRMNQRAPLEDPKSPFRALGKFRFGKQAKLVVSNRGANGYVIVDAVQWEAVP